uniref:Transmembrane protein n=1 Tax=Macrostomum lignano TaxID=282301 RepID=A0A1I8G796_9PLAT
MQASCRQHQHQQGLDKEKSSLQSEGTTESASNDHTDAAAVEASAKATSAAASVASVTADTEEVEVETLDEPDKPNPVEQQQSKRKSQQRPQRVAGALPGCLQASAETWRLWKMETRVLVVCTAVAAASGLLVVLGAFTNTWARLQMVAENGQNLTASQGLWKLSYSVGQQSYDYVLIHLFEDSYERKLDHTITALLRTTVSFIGISLLMMVLSNVFAVYSLKHPRYTFKRAAAALYGMTMACLIVCVDVYTRMLRMERSEKKLIRFPRQGALASGLDDKTVGGTEDPQRISVLVEVKAWSYSYSLIVVILSAVANGMAGILFFLYSKKLKGSRAPNQKVAEANEEFLIDLPPVTEKSNECPTQT